MTKFQRGLNPKVAMEIGEAAYCKKEYNEKLCRECKQYKYTLHRFNLPGQAFFSPSRKYYCNLRYW